MANQMKTTETKGSIVGTLEELNLELVKGLKGTDKFGKEYTYDLIRGKDKKAGMIVDGFDIHVYVPSVWNTETDNARNFKAMVTVMNEYVDKIKASKTEGAEADTVEVTCSYDFNEYADKERKDTVMATKINYQRVTRVDSNREHQAQFYLDKICVRRVAPEIKNEEETGRFKMEVVGFDRNGQITFYNFILEDSEETFEGFTEQAQEFFKAGSTARVDFVLKRKAVGKPKAITDSSKSFGKKANVVESYNITEVLVIGGAVLEEDSENNYKIQDIKEAILLHDNEGKQAIINKAKESDEKRKSKGATGGLKNSGNKNFGTKAKTNEEEDEDSPF